MISCDRTETQSVYSLFQGDAGKVGMPGFPGSDGVPVRYQLGSILYVAVFREETIEMANLSLNVGC